MGNYTLETMELDTFSLPLSIKERFSFWQKLTLNQKVSFIFLLLLLISVPLSLLVALNPVKTQQMAQTPTEIQVETPPIADSFIAIYNPNNNYGNQVIFDVSRYRSDIKKGLMKFNLSGIPANSVILSAKLKLQAVGWSAKKGVIDIYKVLRPWGETSVTWNKAVGANNWGKPGCLGNTDLVLEKATSFEANFGANEIDLRDLVNNWVASPAANQGLILINNTDGTSFTFGSKESENKPKLIISYTSSGPALPSPTLACKADDKGKFSVKSFDRNGYPWLDVYVTAATNYGNAYLCFQQLNLSYPNGFSCYVDPMSLSQGSPNQWHQETVEPAGKPYKLIFLVNKPPSDNGEWCGEWHSTDSPSTTPTPTPISRGYRVFVTSTTYNGNLGGLAGADAKCQERANAANLGGTWKAWLSDSSTSATTRLYHSEIPYKRLDGTIIANNWADLTDGSIQNKIMLSENQSFIQTAYSWTGTRANGETDPNDPNCINWTSSTDNGSYGNNYYTDNRWSIGGIGYPCAPLVHLYCFEQPAPATPTPTSGGVKIATLQAVKDTYDYIYDQSDYCSANLLKVGYKQQHSSLFKFDLASIPSSATVTNAKLQVYASGWSGVNISIGAYRILGDWGCSISTPVGRDTSPMSTITTSGIRKWYEFNLNPTVVKNWLTSPNSNFGVSLNQTVGAPYSFYFSSSEASDTNFRPKLTITYTLP